MTAGVPHPRNYSAFPDVLGRFVRDLKILKLEEAIKGIRKIDFTPVIFTVLDDYHFGRHLRNALSTFPGETAEHVTVRFSSRVRPYIEKSLWHHTKKITAEKDESILFELDEPCESGVKNQIP